MNVRLIGSAASVATAGIAVGVFALIGGSAAKQAPKVQSPVADTVTSIPAAAPAAPAAPVTSAVAVKVQPAVKRQVVVSSSVQAPAPVAVAPRRAAAVNEPTDTPTADAPTDAPAPVSDPATQGPNGGPLPSLLPPPPPETQPIAVPTLPKVDPSPGWPTPTN